METEIKGKLIIEKNGCIQMITITKEAFKNMTRIGLQKAFNDITNDVGGTKWSFEKVD